MRKSDSPIGVVGSFAVFFVVASWSCTCWVLFHPSPVLLGRPAGYLLQSLVVSCLFFLFRKLETEKRETEIPFFLTLRILIVPLLTCPLALRFPVRFHLFCSLFCSSTSAPPRVNTSGGRVAQCHPEGCRGEVPGIGETQCASTSPPQILGQRQHQ